MKLKDLLERRKHAGAGTASLTAAMLFWACSVVPVLGATWTGTIDLTVTSSLNWWDFEGQTFHGVYSYCSSSPDGTFYPTSRELIGSDPLENRTLEGYIPIPGLGLDIGQSQFYGPRRPTFLTVSGGNVTGFAMDGETGPFDFGVGLGGFSVTGYFTERMEISGSLRFNPPHAPDGGGSALLLFGALSVLGVVRYQLGRDGGRTGGTPSQWQPLGR